MTFHSSKYSETARYSEALSEITGDVGAEFNAARTAAFRESVDGLLSSRLRELKLPPEILALYHARTIRSGRAMMASWCLWIASIDCLLTVFDLFIIAPPGLWLVLATRALVIGAALAGRALLRRKYLNRREHVIIITLCVLGICCAGLAGFVAGRPIVAIDYLVSAVLMVTSSIIFLNLDLRYAKFISVIGTVSIGLLTLTVHPASLAIRLQLVCLFGGAMTAMLEARKIVDLYKHRLFLLNLRDEMTTAEAAHLNAQLSSIAYIDQLTNIPNRRYFDEICAAMSESTKNLLPLSICMIDIDHFKALNDNLGHLQGDHCLRIIASTIRLNLRGKTDILVRYGGEEFLLLLPGTDIDRAADIAERVRLAIAGLQHSNPGSAHGVITASIGITMANAHPVQIESLIESADTALYRAKTAGRNRVSV